MQNPAQAARNHTSAGTWTEEIARSNPREDARKEKARFFVRAFFVPFRATDAAVDAGPTYFNL